MYIIILWVGVCVCVCVWCVGLALKVVQLLQLHEHLVAVLSQAMHTIVQEFGSTELVAEIVRSVYSAYAESRWGGKEGGKVVREGREENLGLAFVSIIVIDRWDIQCFVLLVLMLSCSLQGVGRQGP